MAYGKKFAYKDVRGEATAEFAVDVNNNLQSDVLLTYAPIIFSENKRPGVIRLPKALIDQLNGFPREMHGVPIDVLIAIAKGIKADEGKSVLTELS
jgi:hypothetical protein